MFKQLVLIFLFAVSISTFAGTPGKANPDKGQCTYSGKVLDETNLEALTGAIIRIVELDKVVYADFEGFFSFENIPSGHYTFEVSYVSYGKLTKQNVEIEESKSDKRFLLSTI